MKKIGLLGGTFDPPHIGHLVIAEEAHDACKLDEVWFIPVNQPPHKERMVTSSHHRYNMVKAAIETNAHFRVHDIELNREGRSYTVDTIRQLNRLYPEYQFYFILGGDMVKDLPNWHGIDELAQLVTFIAFEREGTGSVPAHIAGSVRKINSPRIDISSSELRDRLKKHQTTAYFIEGSVRDYIEEHGLYET